MKVIVNGWMEVEPIEEGSIFHRLHIVNNLGKKVCRCRYAYSSAGSGPTCRRVDEGELTRGEDGHLHLLDTPVALCEKSERALRVELKLWQKWEEGYGPESA